MSISMPLTPTSFLERSGRAFPDRDALIHSTGKISFGQLLHRSRCLAQACLRYGAHHGDRVAVLTNNSHHAIESHFAIPAIGALIVMINPFLSDSDIKSLLSHCEPKILIISAALHDRLLIELESFRKDGLKLIVIDSPRKVIGDGVIDYEECLAGENGEFFLDRSIRTELDPIAINFTSGTTGKPKGVVYNHRAAYLHALGQVLMMQLNKRSSYLWTLPIFHVSGWGHMWAAVAAGCRQIITSGPATSDPDTTLENIEKYDITHIAGAPRLIRWLIEGGCHANAFRGLTVVTGGAAPPAVLIQQLELLGATLIHQYGLSETLGPFVVCEEHEGWQQLPIERRAAMRMRQGVAGIHAGTGLRVIDAQGNEVPCDGQSLGEVVMSGNTVATGYYKNFQATESAFVAGWFHSGDMAVVHPDGYLEIRDRKKDLIFIETAYGWENISSIEIENALCHNEAIQDAAVIAVPAQSSVEKPLLVAFIELRGSAHLSEDDLKWYCDESLSIYKRPDKFVIKKLPKTSTGKVRKDLLSAEFLGRLEAAL